MDFLVELRAAEVSGNTLVGHAAVFNQPTQIRGGWEQIAPGAFDAALERGDDVVALRDHDPKLLLGRTRSGTLRLGVDDDGLVFEADLPDTEYARDVRALVSRGDLAGASFGFLPGQDSYLKGPEGRQIRTHTSVARLVDVSVVSTPAYTGTSVALRAADLSSRSVEEQFLRARVARLLKG